MKQISKEDPQKGAAGDAGNKLEAPRASEASEGIVTADVITRLEELQQLAKKSAERMNAVEFVQQDILTRIKTLERKQDAPRQNMVFASPSKASRSPAPQGKVNPASEMSAQVIRTHALKIEELNHQVSKALELQYEGDERLKQLAEKLEDARLQT